jgi:hypothetical protein
MAGCSIINHKGREILYYDHRGLGGRALLDNIRLAMRTTRDYTGRPVLSLSNFTDVKPERAALSIIDSDDMTAVQQRVDRGAVVGLNGQLVKFLDLHNKVAGVKYRHFASEEEAKEFLIG